ncbi:hypothetical protein EW145_g4624 [Phellinidium pouzarii]|uniref:ABC1 atypical kinase-like domain-containing protein n=1 Tax=Phellinidium pouzarii TaxID=167371 RepID=A0A4S4L311_9AGAM|nr:hypothetical protein EW145_g4624 [Phellinidium pouzarii]
MPASSPFHAEAALTFSTRINPQKRKDLSLAAASATVRSVSPPSDSTKSSMETVTSSSETVVHSYPPTPSPTATAVKQPPSPATVHAKLDTISASQKPIATAAPVSAVKQFLLAPHSSPHVPQPEDTSLLTKALSMLKNNKPSHSLSFTLCPLPSSDLSSPSSSDVQQSSPAHIGHFKRHSLARLGEIVPPSPPSLFTFHDPMEREFGVDRSFWITLALVYMEFLTERELPPGVELLTISLSFYLDPDILAHAASIRAAQAVRANAELRRGFGLRDGVERDRRRAGEDLQEVAKEHEYERPKKPPSIRVDSSHEIIEDFLTTHEASRQIKASAVMANAELKDLQPMDHTSERAISQEAFSYSNIDSKNLSVRDAGAVKGIDETFPTSSKKLHEPPLYSAPKSQFPVPDDTFESSVSTSQTQRNLQASRVPSSRIGRLFHYGGLAASLGYGAASEALRRASSSQTDASQSSLMMSPANVSRLVEKLSRMRGAALKLGQFMSIQGFSQFSPVNAGLMKTLLDSHILPKDVEEVFRRVQDSAHYMPNWQMEHVMADSLGPTWASNFASFEAIPFAAASLGQVHSAVLAAHASPTKKNEKVAVKIQFPDIARSIESDLGYLKILLNAGRMLPKGLFLDKTIQAMKGELADECDYLREASSAQFFASEDGVGRDARFRVPWIWDGSTERVLVMQHMDGVSVGGNVVDTLSQESRDKIASMIVELCMKELFDFRTMQTDPNWSNFLWNEPTGQIELIDFGATRSYSKEFMDRWMHLLQAAVAEDREKCVHWSLELGYLTGAETETMLDAHVHSLTLLATPFRARSSTEGDGRYAFGKGSEWAGITAEIRSFIPVMLNERLTPPPKETYSLNRRVFSLYASHVTAN